MGSLVRVVVSLRQKEIKSRCERCSQGSGLFEMWRGGGERVLHTMNQNWSWLELPEDSTPDRRSSVSAVRVETHVRLVVLFCVVHWPPLPIYFLLSYDACDWTKELVCAWRVFCYWTVSLASFFNLACPSGFNASLFYLGGLLTSVATQLNTRDLALCPVFSDQIETQFKLSNYTAVSRVTVPS